MIAEGMLLSPEITEMIVYAVILLFGGEKALQMKRRRNGGDSMTNGKVLAVRLKAVEDAINKMDGDSVKVAVAELRATIDGIEKSMQAMHDSIKEIWAELRRAG